MARGPIKEKVYTGRALKLFDKVKKLEDELKAAKEELKEAYKEQLKAEKEATKKAAKARQAELLDIIEKSGKTPDEIIEMLKKS